MLNGAGLAYPKDTTTIWWDEDGTITADGPFTAAAEQLTAYYMIDCASLERARAIAERVLDFHVTTVEVRPVHDSFGSPTPELSTFGGSAPGGRRDRRGTEITWKSAASCPSVIRIRRLTFHDAVEHHIKPGPGSAGEPHRHRAAHKPLP